MSEVTNIEAESENSLRGLRKQLEDYISLLENLSPDNLGKLKELTDSRVEFVDPFNRVVGQASMIGVFSDMFERLNGIRFKVIEWHCSPIEGGCVAYLYWKFSGYSQLTGGFQTEGTSRVLMSHQGKVVKHQDFWDASVLIESLPLLGRLCRIVRKRAAYREK